MAYYYANTDAGSDSNAGSNWIADAMLTLEGLLGVMSAGDTGFIQGAAADTAAATRTFTIPAGVKITGCADGTTNTGASIVPSDLTSTLIQVSATGGGSDMVFNTGAASFYGIHFTAGDKILGSSPLIVIENGKLTSGDDIVLGYDGGGEIRLINSIFEPTISTGRFLAGHITMLGGSTLSTVSTPVIDAGATAVVLADFNGVDISSLGSTAFSYIAGAIKIKLANCKISSSFTFFTATPTKGFCFAEAIGCSHLTAAKGVGTSYLDYMYEDMFGTVDTQSTIVRTGGADDKASGGFAYEMTPHNNATLEGAISLKSPWMNVWVAGGSNTLTVYICNSDATPTDFNEDEVWVEFYTPDDADTAQHDQTFDPADEHLLNSTTAITDDTGSTWSGTNYSHQKLSVTVTAGFEGVAYARLHYAKRFASSPTVLYLDPKMIVT